MVRGAELSVHVHARCLGLRNQIVAPGEPVLQAPEGVGEMPLESFAFDAPEHVAEIQIARAGFEMHLVAIAVAVGQAHLANVREVERIGESGDTLWNQVGMVYRE